MLLHPPGWLVNLVQLALLVMIRPFTGFGRDHMIA
jgi:hypothetical protein